MTGRPRRCEFSEAVLQTPQGRITYLRSGHGSAVLLLRLPSSSGPEDPAFRHLARSHRVFSAVVPLPPAGSGSWGCGSEELGALERWLLEFVEGLGLDRPDVYARPPLVSMVARIAGRLDGVVGNIFHLEHDSVATPHPS